MTGIKMQESGAEDAGAVRRCGALPSSEVVNTKVSTTF
jgi:hypothetical protein